MDVRPGKQYKGELFNNLSLAIMSDSAEGKGRRERKEKTLNPNFNPIMSMMWSLLSRSSPIIRGINGARPPSIMRGINGARAISNFSSSSLETEEESEWLREKLLERKEMERRLNINKLEMNELEMKKKTELSEKKIGQLLGWEIKQLNQRPPQGSKVSDGSRSLEPTQEQGNGLFINNITKLMCIRFMNACTGVFQRVTIRMEVKYKYSIPKCMEVYQSIGGFTSHEDLKVYHLFNDAANREFFLSLEDGKRAEWLRNMLTRI